MTIGAATRFSAATQLPTVRSGLRQYRVMFTLVLEWLVLIAGLGYLCGRTFPRAWHKVNTDFPNYYITARLLREGYNTDRLYEWSWMQRQKNRMGIGKNEQSVVTFVPLTPVSGILLWPLTYWPPLTAKHIWIVINVGLMIVLAAVLHRITSLTYRRLALFVLMCFPLHRNLINGQYYLLLTLLFAIALWLYLRNRRSAAGIVLGICFGLKIFPLLFLLYFLRKKDWQAAAGMAIGAGMSMLASLLAFGVQLNRIYIFQVLPWALRGETMDPYNVVGNYLSAMVHHLLILEPEWNPHPLTHAPMLAAVLQPLLQGITLMPIILLVRPHDMRSRVLRLEWAAYIVLLLAIEMPGSYHFTLLIVPMAIIAAILVEDRRFTAVVCLVTLYVAVCFPLWDALWSDRPRGALASLGMPRLFFTIVFLFFSCTMLVREQLSTAEHRRERWVWVGVLACASMLGAGVSLRHSQNIYKRQSERLLTSPGIFLATEPTVHNGSIFFTSMLADGYRVGQRTGDRVDLSDGLTDRLGLVATSHKLWAEESHNGSRIVSMGADLAPQGLEVEDAEFPVPSRDGKWLAYLRSERGSGRIWLRSLNDEGTSDKPATPVGLNVLEMTFLPDDSLIFAAAQAHQAPHIFYIDSYGKLLQLSTEEARYPSVSPDGEWLAYARQSAGVWNLWLRNRQTGEERRVTNADCNDVFPSWEADSKTLIFASDCGRGLGLTALYRQRALP